MRVRGSAKAATGIAGLDDVMRGGLPRGRTTLVFGGAGCGKTVLALEALVHGAQRGEPGVLVAFEETSEAIMQNAAAFGWNLESLVRRKKLFIIDATLSPDVVRAGSFDLTGLLAVLGAKIHQMGATRAVFDGIDVLLTLLDDAAAERRELFRIHEWLRDHELTGIITAKTESRTPFSQARYGFAAYMADCALLLERRHQDGVSERELSVLKYRGSSFAENATPFVIGDKGIDVAEVSPTGTVRTSTQRISTGVERLDTMLSGGYLRRASVLVTGLPGTAKSSLCGSFVRASCERGERAVYVSFDEHAEETVRNLASIGIRLQPFISKGLLRVVSLLAQSDNAEVQLMRVRNAVRAHRAKTIVVDPISAIGKSSAASVSIGGLARFIHWCKVNDTTLVCASLLSSPDPNLEAAQLGVSTLADTWIHLSYAQHGGERNRALTIVKSRGTHHSNQLRELILSDDGITLADVYEAGGEVFMGTLRWEKENAARDAEERETAHARRRRVELERAHAELVARREMLARELELNEAELAAAGGTERARLDRGSRRHVEMLRLRHADEDA